MKFYKLLVFSLLSLLFFQCNEESAKQKSVKSSIIDTIACSQLIFSDSLAKQKIYYPETMDTLRGWCQGLKNGQAWQGYTAASIFHDTLLAIKLYEFTPSEKFKGVLNLFFEKSGENTWCLNNEKTEINYSAFVPGAGACVSQYYEEDKQSNSFCKFFINTNNHRVYGCGDFQVKYKTIRSDDTLNNHRINFKDVQFCAILK